MNTPDTFISVEQLRQSPTGPGGYREWARSYTWNACFSSDRLPLDIPEEFATWFPATEIDINIASVENQSFTAGIHNFSIPRNAQEYTLNMTVIDDFHLNMTNFIYYWINKIVDLKKGCILPLKNACGICSVALFDSKANNVREGHFLVYPNMQLQLSRDSSNGIVQTQFEFIIAGIKGKAFFNLEGDWLI